jgi:hypothetical protein
MFKEMNRTRILLSSVAALALISSSAVAEEGAASATLKIAVRTGVHEDYTRLVFECPAPPAYQAKATENSLTLDFAKAVAIDSGGSSLASLPRISGVKASGEKTVQIDFAKGMSVRHFVIGNRLIVDLRGKEDPQKKEEQAPQKPEAAKEQPKAQAETKTPKEPKTEPKKEEVVAPKAKEPEASEEKPETAPYTVNVTATETIGFAAFTRYGYVWVVVDQPNFRSPAASRRAAQRRGFQMGKFPAQRGDGVSRQTSRNAVSVRRGRRTCLEVGRNRSRARYRQTDRFHASGCRYCGKRTGDSLACRVRAPRKSTFQTL